MKVIYVVAHDGGYEGYSLPFLAFTDRQKAFDWVASQEPETWCVAEVPVFPELPKHGWAWAKRLEP